MSKCEFGVTSVNYPGHIVSAKGVEPDPEKVTSIMEWPTPRNLTALHGFLGLTGFYRRFVRQYAQHASPLTDLLKQGAFTWNEKIVTTLQKLKELVTSTPVLAFPDFKLPFDLETDASGTSIGAVLSQNSHP